MPNINAPDIVLNENNIGLGKPVDWNAIPSSQSDLNPIASGPNFNPDTAFSSWESKPKTKQKFNPEAALVNGKSLLRRRFL